MMVSGPVLLTINSHNASQKDASEESAVLTEEAVETSENDTVSAADRFDTSGKDINAYTAGRINIWKGYASHLNMWGNAFDDVKIHEVTGGPVVHAHNNFLEIAYRCGVPVACIHLLLELYTGIICIVFLFGKNNYFCAISYRERCVN